MTAAEEVQELPDGLLRTQVLAAMTCGAPFDRRTRPAHVTASAVVLDPTAQHVLLVRHRKLGLWLHPGGHVDDGDASLAAAARREAVEETGAADLEQVGGALDLHRHPAPCAPPGEADHLDVRFVVVADRAAVPVVSDESTDVRWWRVDDLPAYAVPDLPALVRKAAQRVSSTW